MWYPYVSNHPTITLPSQIFAMLISKRHRHVTRETVTVQTIWMTTTILNRISPWLPLEKKYQLLSLLCCLWSVTVSTTRSPPTMPFIPRYQDTIWCTVSLYTSTPDYLSDWIFSYTCSNFHYQSFQYTHWCHLCWREYGRHAVPTVWTWIQGLFFKSTHDNDGDNRGNGDLLPPSWVHFNIVSSPKTALFSRMIKLPSTNLPVRLGLFYL